MKSDPGSTPMRDLLAFFLTWTTYGSWLPGDERGWVDNRGNIMAADPERERDAAERMVETELTLDRQQRGSVIEARSASKGVCRAADVTWTAWTR